MKHLALILLLAACGTAEADSGNVKTRLCDKTDSTKCAAVDSTGKVSIAGTISASTTAHATAAAPTYVEGTDNALSVDLSGNLRTAGGAAATSTAINDGTTTTQKLAVDAAGKIGLNNFPASQAVTGTFWQATQPVSGTFWQATQPVSGTVAATQSGTWTVQPGNTANTTPWLFDLNKVAGTATVTGGLAGSVGVGGLAAEGGAVSGNPVYSAGRGFNAIAFAPRYCDKIAAITTLGTTATVQQIALVASQKIYICGYLIKASTATAGINLKWVEGTGSNCVTGQADVTPTIFTTPTAAPATANFTLGPFGSPGIPWMATAGDALCINQSAATNSTTLSGVIFYTQN